MAAPARTPTEIVQRMAREVNAVVQQPEVRDKITEMGFSPVAGTPEAFTAAYRKDYPVWQQLVKVSGARLD
jgi:tripartite-type tricarboxylate transporter receptor subunit TctC